MTPSRPLHDDTHRRDGASDRRHRSSRAAVSVETLEGRALLSQLAPGLIRAHAVHAQAAQVSAGGLRLGPVVERTGPGFVVKSPRFNPAYTGVPRSELNAAGLKAAFDGNGNLYLTGIVAANDVPQQADDSTPEAYYAFGINRGGATTPGPFPHRPRLTFDAVVVVSITQTGASAQVIDQTTGTTTDLGPESLVFKQNALQVTVPSGVLGAVPGTNLRAWSANFWTQSAPTQNLSDIASFAPESHNVVFVPAVHHFRPTPPTILT